MKKKTVVISVLLIIWMGLFPLNMNSIQEGKKTENVDRNIQLYSSAVDNLGILEEALDFKLADYSTNGYFSDLYKTSIHAIYYAISALDSLGRLNLIDEFLVKSFIMRHFNDSSEIFEDDYSRRYLSIDFSRPYRYYPCTSLLEINCYAVLSLETLGGLDLVDNQGIIDFIWSCYNPVTSGFIGQPYDSSMQSQFKISTMDNTYFAIKALLALGDDWTGHSDEKDDLISFVNGLQKPQGSFNNDEDPIFQSLYPQEVSMLSAYYCVKTLQLFEMISSINMATFHSYLADNYVSPLEHPEIVEDDFFVFYSTENIVNKSNLIATAMGLELATITQFTGCDEQEAIQFLRDHRNSLGNWEDGTEYGYHELMYTFQIMRSLKAIDAQLTVQEKDEIGNAIMKYYDGYSGFCLISPDYTSVEYINCVINSFDAMDRLGELDAISGDIFNTEIDVLKCDEGYPYFLYATGMNTNYAIFNTCPVELYNAGSKQKVKNIDSLTSIKNNYLALETMEKIFKLDDLNSTCDLQLFIDEIVACQLLDPGEDNFGAFLPFHDYIFLDQVFLEHAYYAMKTLKLLAGYMGIGSMLDFAFDHSALFTYIFRNIEETPSILYFDPVYTNDIETILQNTYYMIYILKAIDLYALNDQKIENFIAQNINYLNLKNIYYCYKISTLLEIDFDFDVIATQTLIDTLYHPGLREFYLTTEMNLINQEAFLWVCDMAANDRIRITPSYDSEVMIGEWNNISCTLGNMVLTDFGAYASVRFESPQVEMMFLENHDKLFYKKVYISKEFSNYSKIEGNLSVYRVANKVAWRHISFNISKTGDSHDSITPSFDSALPNAIPLIISLVTIPSCAIVLSLKQKNKTKRKFFKS